MTGSQPGTEPGALPGAPLGVGVIGLGVGMRLAEGFARDGRCRIAALCDIDPDRLAQGLAAHPGARPHASAEALIEDPEVAIVVVASYDDAHHAQVLRALAAGRHVFAEKPLCLLAEHADEIHAALRARPDLVLTTNTVLRMSPRFRRLKQDVAADLYGEIYYAEADYDYGRLAKLTEGWRGRTPGYSVMLGGGIHMADLLLWLMEAERVEVCAMGANRCARNTSFEGDDLTVALVRFADGRVAKLGANFGCVRPHFHRLALYGTAATFENRPGPAELWTSRAPDLPPERLDIAYPGTHKADLAPSFVDAVLGLGEPVVDADSVFRALDLCLAVDRAAVERRPVSVPSRPRLRCV